LDRIDDRHEMLYLSAEDVRALEPPMRDVVTAVEEAFRIKGAGEVAMPPKVTLQSGGGSFAQVMPAWIGSQGDAGGALGIKFVTVMPQNPAHGLPATNALIVLDDPLTGLPQAVLDGGRITGLRTGAGVAVAARHLAVADVSCVGVLGCGVQARNAVRALAVVLPALTRVRCHDVVPAAAAAFAAEMPTLVAADQIPTAGLTLEVCERPQDVCAGAGVVLTAITMGDAEPPLGAGLLEPGALAVALDYDAAWSAAAMAACDRFVTDDIAQTLATKEHGPRLGGIPDLDADLGDIVAGRVAGRSDAHQRIFCLDLGIAVEDIVCARAIYERAAETGVGRRLPL
jgi:ornithine cyclodeaminase/alanine dehydrogenase-like protein (mu-crystallin family)